MGETYLKTYPFLEMFQSLGTNKNIANLYKKQKPTLLQGLKIDVNPIIRDYGAEKLFRQSVADQMSRVNDIANKTSNFSALSPLLANNYSDILKKDMQFG